MQQQILRLPRVREATGLSRSELYRRIARGDFPKPVRFSGSRSVGWSNSEVQAWIARQISARDGGTERRNKARRPGKKSP